jgi:hypothetical protein
MDLVGYVINVPLGHSVHHVPELHTIRCGPLWPGRAMAAISGDVKGVAHPS